MQSKGRRFRPTPWPTAAMLVVMAVTLALGNWQRERANFKSEIAGRLAHALSEPPIAASDVVADPRAAEFRLAAFDGRFLPGRQLFLDNRVLAGRVGFHVLGVFESPGIGSILVNRGWVEQVRGRRDPAAAPPPVNQVRLVGRVTLPVEGYFGAARDPSVSSLWLHIDLGKMGDALAVPLALFVVEQTEPTGPEDRLERAWAAPDFGVDRHRGYMVQWWSLSALAGVLWLALNWRAAEEPGNG